MNMNLTFVAVVASIMLLSISSVVSSVYSQSELEERLRNARLPINLTEAPSDTEEIIEMLSDLGMQVESCTPINESLLDPKDLADCNAIGTTTTDTLSPQDSALQRFNDQTERIRDSNTNNTEGNFCYESGRCVYITEEAKKSRDLLDQYRK